MKTLEQHNQERSRQHGDLGTMAKPHPNGIACPQCGEELWDSSPWQVLASIPPQKEVHCPGCGHRGYRVA